MTIASQKKLVWFAFDSSLGWIALVTVFALRISPEVFRFPLIVGWTAAHVVVGVLSVLWLRRCYSREPLSYAGFWHVTLSDICASTFLAALSMFFWQAVWPESFQFWGAGISIVAGGSLLGALLLSERMGHRRFTTKIPMALALLFKAYGLTALGALISVCLSCIAQEGLGDLFSFLTDVGDVSIWYRTWDSPSHNDWMYLSLQTGLAVYPIGWIMTRLMRGKGAVFLG